MLGLTEEIGLIGGQQIDRDLQFGRLRAAFQQPQIVAVAIELIMRQPLGQAAADQRLLAVKMPAAS
jgi:hypothetical protein